MRLSACVGEYAKTPYEIVNLECRVYCIEELCYALKENAFLLDTTIMNDGLVNWIDSECGLKDLARELHPLVHRQGSLSAFVATIQEYVGMYNAETIRIMTQILKFGAGLTNIEKRKKQIDYLVTRKKYVAALRSYDILLYQWEELEREGKEVPGKEVQAAIIHNKAVVYARMMLYEQAAEEFMRAYQLAGDEADFESYLAAKRIRMDDREYVAFAATYPERHEQTLELEKKMDALRASFEEQPGYELLERRRNWRMGSEKQRYYEDNEELTRNLKNGYRNCVSE